MIRKRKHALAIFLLLPLLGVGSCTGKFSARNRLDEQSFPQVVLWAWERPEDLRFLDPKRYAVAFLAQTLVLKADGVSFNPRHQPLELSPETKLIAVTRIETQKITGAASVISDSQREETVALILKTLDLQNVAAIQVDFDAAKSERDFYRALLRDLRGNLPDRIPLSITALASFCVGDRWLSNLPVDEAVPMAFRMGADDKAIRDFLAGGEDFREPLCQRSYGIASDEPIDLKFRAGRRVYIFNNRSWKTSDVVSVSERIRP